MMRPFGNQESLKERQAMTSSNGLNIRPQRFASIEREAGLTAREQSSFTGFGHLARTATGEFGFEILDSSELALRLTVKESWVVEQSKLSRTRDPQSSKLQGRVSHWESMIRKHSESFLPAVRHPYNRGRLTTSLR